MKFLVAYDSSPTARRALQRALDLMQVDRDHLVVLMVSEELPDLLMTEETVQRVTAARLHDAKRVLQGLSDMLSERKIPHETVATPAYDTAQEIMDQAAEHEADMLVLGSRGMSGLQGLLMGSISQRCVNEASMPVMIVHAPGSGTTVEEIPSSPLSLS